MNKNLKSALIYAGHFNFAVLPVHTMTSTGCSCNNPSCNSPAKHPRNSNGVSGATKDINQINEWWTKWPDANIGIACGEISQITVIDVDVKQQIDGLTTIKNLEKLYDSIPVTPMQNSGGNGQHYFFKYEPSIKTSVRNLPGIDIRNDKSFIIAAPSVHASMRIYRWVTSNHICKVKLSKMPDWLLSVLKGPEVQSRSVRNSYDKWYSIITGVQEGGRNNAATSLVGYLFYKNIDLSIILWVMENWNKQNKPPLQVRELENVILSVAKMQGVRI